MKSNFNSTGTSNLKKSQDKNEITDKIHVRKDINDNKNHEKVSSWIRKENFNHVLSENNF